MKIKANIDQKEENYQRKNPATIQDGRLRL